VQDICPEEETVLILQVCLVQQRSDKLKTLVVT